MFAIYTLLVVPPVAGLILILRAGGSLHAPRSIGGDWRVMQTGSCAAVRSAGPVELHIAQSGSHAVGTFDDDARTTVALAVRDRAVPGGETSGCVITFDVGASAGDAGRVWTLDWRGCGDCPGEGFVATRKPRPRGTP